MELRAAIRSRRSTAPISQQAPPAELLVELVRLAAHGPDHAGLRAWRLITIQGEGRRRLGEAMAAGFGDEPGTAAAAKTASKPERAPLLISIVAVPVEHPKVPRWEQTASIGALVGALELLLFEAGFTAMWRTGPGVELAEVRKLLGIGAHEQLLGWLYVGATEPGSGPPHGDPDIADRITALPG